MLDVVLSILGGLACMAFMCGVAMWLTAKRERRLVWNWQRV